MTPAPTPSRPPLALTLPDDGAASTRRTIARVLKKLARDALRFPAAAAGSEAQAIALAQDLVRRFGETDPQALYTVLRRPHVHVQLTCAWRSLDEGDRDLAGLRIRRFAFRLLGDLALEGTLTREVAWPGRAPLPTVASPARRASIPIPEGSRLSFVPGGLRIDRRDVPERAPSDRFVPVAHGVVLALEDDNPISDFEAHPDKTGNRLDLGAAAPEAWASSLAGGLALVERHLPELRREMDALLQVFVPVGTDDEKHLSASYREALGLVYLTLHPRLMTMTEAIVHEYQHNKLNLLFHLDPVMENAWWPLYRSPVRPDPRPLHGVLLAAHAFVPVAEMYRRMIETEAPESRSGGFLERFRQILGKNAEALDTLTEHAKPSEAGREVLESLVSLHREHVALGV